jgi:hypothetical protein
MYKNLYLHIFSVASFVGAAISFLFSGLNWQFAKEQHLYGPVICGITFLSLTFALESFNLYKTLCPTQKSKVFKIKQKE